MSSLTSTRLALLAGAALLASAPGRADAQFGGLRKKLEQQVQKAVGSAGESAPSAAPTFSDRVLEITDARVAMLVAGLRAEAGLAAQEAQAQRALDAKNKEWEAKNEKYAKCVEPLKDELLKNTGVMMGLALAAKREEAKKGAVSPALRDSIAALTARMQKAGDAMQAKCGDGPGPNPFESMGDSADPEEVGAKAAGLSRDQYAVLRERVTAYVLNGPGRTGRYAFAAGERAALDRHASELAPFRAQLRGG